MIGRIGQFGIAGGRSKLPSLAQDFLSAPALAQAVRTGPSPTFSRGTPVHARGADGDLVEWASDEAAFLWDAVGDPLGYLHEPQRTGLFERSQAINDSAWTKTGATVTTNGAVAPTGNASGDTLVEDGTNDVHRVNQSVSVTGGGQYAFSVWAKQAGRSWLRMVATNFDTSNPAVYFDLSAGTIGTEEAGASGFIEDWGNGWYRCGYVATASGTGTANCFLQITTGDGVSGAYAGDGASGIHLFGVQIEAGSFPTSYIETAAAAATRNEPALTWALADIPGYDPSRGVTLAVRHAVRRANDGSTAEYPVRLDDGSNNYPSNYVMLRLNGLDDFVVNEDGSSITDTGAGLFTGDGSPHTLVLRIGPSGATIWEDGAQAYSDAVDYSGVLANVTDLRLGYQVDGTYKRLKLWPRLLSDAECQRESAA